MRPLTTEFSIACGKESSWGGNYKDNDSILERPLPYFSFSLYPTFPLISSVLSPLRVIDQVRSPPNGIDHALVNGETLSLRGPVHVNWV